VPLRFRTSLAHSRRIPSYSFGPDPYLNGESAFETIVGVQSVGVQACAKHFIANNQEHWRYGLTANVNDRTLHEIYFYPFLRSIEVGF
jgi:beta-glucosidase